MKYKTLENVMPTEFMSCEYDKTRAAKMRNVFVLRVHSSFDDQDKYKIWPGNHKNVFFWVELENGYFVGWNENPSRGWSFPVIKRPNS